MLSHLVAALLCANAVTLDATTKTVELTTGVAISTDYVVSYVDGASGAYTPGTNQGNVATATTTTILAAPAASTQRAVTRIVITNRGTATQTAQVKLDVSATEYALTPNLSLNAGESLQIDNAGTATILTAGGIVREVAPPYSGFAGFNLPFYKVGTASEAVAVNYLHAKDTGVPGAWAPGTPGLNGTADTCAASAGAVIAGSHVLPDPAAGGRWLVGASWTSTVLQSHTLYDLIWHNTGLVVTTTTAQGITSPAWGARDERGTTNGDGFIAGILVTTATTQAGAVTTITLNYTNSEGVASRTGTMASFPATAVLGTFVPFQLAAGDDGIRSIQGITLGTTLTAGAISLVVLKPLIRVPVTLVNLGNRIDLPPPGIRLWPGTCLWLGYLSTATTLTTTAADFTIMER